ncbi:G-patch domain-containing protein [Fennellomyces sp. T-0311]|nr:G-patch domain-containing protein [Fennellomyces sp. T-0311]
MEQATMEAHIPQTNMGYRLLQKMGWKEGQGLGSRGQGRVDPIRIDIKEDALGVGKAEEEAAYHASSTAKRKTMGSERQLEETESERILRESKVKEKEMIAQELREVKRAFYCELCDKQYSKVAEYEQHLQSYDHHHRKRFKDMKEQSRKSGFAQSNKDKQRERERKREERELKRMQEAMLKRAGAPQQQQPTQAPLPVTTSSRSGGGWVSVDQNGPSTAPPRAAPATPAVTEPPAAPIKSTGGWTMATSTAADTTEKKPAAPTKMSFGLPQKKPSGFRFNLKKK